MAIDPLGKRVRAELRGEWKAESLSRRARRRIRNASDQRIERAHAKEELDRFEAEQRQRIAAFLRQSSARLADAHDGGGPVFHARDLRLHEIRK